MIKKYLFPIVCFINTLQSYLLWFRESCKLIITAAVSSYLSERRFPERQLPHLASMLLASLPLIFLPLFPPFRFLLFQEKPPDHRKPQDMACCLLQDTSSRHKRSRNDPLLWLTMIFLFPLYGIFPEIGKTGFRALRVFPVATVVASDENSHRTSPDRAT